jgi:hypothetical protein
MELRANQASSKHLLLQLKDSWRRKLRKKPIQPSSTSKRLVDKQEIQPIEVQPDEAEADTEGDDEVVDEDLTVKEVSQARLQLEEDGVEQLLTVRKPLANEELTTRWEEQVEARFEPTKLTVTSGLQDEQIIGAPIDLFEDLQRWVRDRIEKLEKEHRNPNLLVKWRFLQTVLEGAGELDEKKFKANYPKADLRWMDSERMKQQALLHMMEH